MTDLDLDAIEARRQVACLPYTTEATISAVLTITRIDVPALVALVRAKQSWIDGAKVDMAAMEEEIETLRTARNEVTASKARIVAERDDLVDEVEQLRNTRDPFDYYGNLKAERDTARAAVARVRALHVPEWVVIDYVGGSVCRECREPVESEPCATIRALDGAS